MPEELFSRNEDAIVRRIAGETLLVPIRAKLADMQRIYALNEVARFVWERLDGRRTLAELAAAVAEEFDVGKAEAERDLRALVAALAAEGLVRRE